MKAGKKRQRLTILFVTAVSASAILLAAAAVNRTIPVRSDSRGVRIVTENDLVKEVSIEGVFPYRKLIASEERQVLRDEAGRAVEEIRTYTPAAAFSLNASMSLKIDTEGSDGFIHTNVIRFADKTVVIRDGRMEEDRHDG